MDRFIPSAATYFARKQEMATTLRDALSRESQTLDPVTVDINTLDDLARGESGMHLTVLGTSAEGGDGGQVGLGNKVNGIYQLHPSDRQ